MIPFPSQQWANHFKDALNVNPNYKTKAASWEGDFLFIITPDHAYTHELTLYLDLWHAYPDALRIAYKAQDMPIGDLGRLHRAFTAGVLRVFDRARQAGILRSGDPRLAGHVMRQVAVPLLELYGGHPDGDRLFVEGLRGLLLTGPPEAAGAALSSRRPRGGTGRAS